MRDALIWLYDHPWHIVFVVLLVIMSALILSAICYAQDLQHDVWRDGEGEE